MFECYTVYMYMHSIKEDTLQNKMFLENKTIKTQLNKKKKP